MFQIPLKLRFHTHPLFRFNGVGLILSLFITFSAFAENTLKDQNKNLHKLLPDSRGCMEEMPIPIPETNKRLKKSIDKHTQAHSEKIVFNCLSSIDVIYSDWKQVKALLIDVREPDYFDRNKIPGSINLPLYMLKYKESLKNRNIVLINKGARLHALEMSCLELKTKGFKQVSVMEGGVKSWVDAGYSMTGGKLSVDGFSDLSPSEFVSAIPEREWVFIDLDHSSQALVNLIFVSGAINYTEDFSSLIAQVDAIKASHKPGQLIGFLVVSQDGKRYRSVKDRFQDYGIKDVYYLSGGVSGFKQFVQKHSAQMERQRKGF
ncbi:MAG: rhodanese-like domain-containing protein, partial [Candidatus Thiodiazotropha sp. (ex Lucinoma annulata)]|nr:rhodanese-like domain-containing protein [Candidatus Thiodiazotropha sp. (ex Lucinoma annulata)]